MNKPGIHGIGVRGGHLILTLFFLLFGNKRLHAYFFSFSVTETVRGYNLTNLHSKRTEQEESNFDPHFKCVYVLVVTLNLQT